MVHLIMKSYYHRTLGLWNYQSLMKDKSKLIKASEIGEYVFCARAWRLRMDGYEQTSGHEARKAGTQWHLKHGRAIRRARLLHRVAALSGLLTIVVAVLLILFWWWE